MTPIEFIEKNIINELSKLGYDLDACMIGAKEAIRFYQRSASSSGKGKMFDDCLNHAKLFAKKYNLKK